LLTQLLPYLKTTEIVESFQSGFKTIETALLKVTNYLLLTLESDDNAILVLLYLSATFDTVDHGTLLKHLEHWVGIKGTALNWFHSYLLQRPFFSSLSIGQYSSSPASVSYGVPQGSILGPVLFCLDMLPLGNIIRKCDISFHSMQPLLDCLKEINIRI